MANTVTDELVLRHHLLFAVLFWHWGESCFLVGTLRLCDKRLRLRQCPHRFNSSKLEPGGVWKSHCWVNLHISVTWILRLQKCFLMLPINRNAFLSFSIRLSGQLSNRIMVTKWVVSLMLSPQKSPLPTPNKVYVFRNRAQQWPRNV